MPHVKRVCCRDKRLPHAGRFTCIDTPRDGGFPKLIVKKSFSEFTSQVEASNFVASLRLSPELAQDVLCRTIVVEDLSERAIEALGAAFHLNPEFLAAHLLGSNCCPCSYDDWRTREIWKTMTIPKDYTSLDWMRPVQLALDFKQKNAHRNDVKPSDQYHKFVAFLESSRSGALRTNIFRFVNKIQSVD
ncbi:hypothetical protein EJ06DRAFT_372129 [Trichodelitschia bisporula]|uniref:Uncharacterized protein n=1 Tax=Trichodelitschia bisporula TaxID=703511 RepID=A0A6G1I175_9PEZI|nr:hypothetical protein EJ06DRAFT_372129 [Trichodelitschia bisporula]